MKEKQVKKQNYFFYTLAVAKITYKAFNIQNLYIGFPSITLPTLYDVIDIIFEIVFPTLRRIPSKASEILYLEFIFIIYFSIFISNRFDKSRFRTIFKKV